MEANVITTSELVNWPGLPSKSISDTSNGKCLKYDTFIPLILTHYTFKKYGI